MVLKATPPTIIPVRCVIFQRGAKTASSTPTRSATA